MTRAEKIQRIKKYRPCLYMTLRKHVPLLIADPENASPRDIEFYNYYVKLEAFRDNNNATFKNRFSF